MFNIQAGIIMKHYIIDGNNLIGKIKSLQTIMHKDGQTAREKVVFMIENYFQGKQVKVSLCFDGYQKTVIRTVAAKIYYSDRQSADDQIKRLIEQACNPRTIILVSSDHNLMQFANVCRCEVISSEKFAGELTHKKQSDSDDEKSNSISNAEIRKLFGV
ncbi:MAG: NYN domain-containing protein [Ignavibacteria bacterium]